MAQPEFWKPVSGYLSYFASSAGRVGSDKGRRQKQPGEPYFIMRPFNQDGYPRVNLSVGGKTRGQFVHRLVALAFLGEPPAGRPYVAHCNGDRWDNRPANLRWASAPENIADRTIHRFPKGRIAERGSPTGRLPRLTRYAMLRDYLETPLSMSEIAVKYGVTHGVVSRLVRDKERFLKPASELARNVVYVEALREIEAATRNINRLPTKLLLARLEQIRRAVVKSLTPDVMGSLPQTE